MTDTLDPQMVAEQQSALLRIATIVAKGTDSNVMFSAVADELLRLLPGAVVSLSRYNSGDHSFTLHATTRPQPAPVLLGSTRAFDESPLAARVVRTRRPVELHGWTPVPGQHLNGSAGRALGAPIIVGPEIWGVLSATFAERTDPLPSWSRRRLGEFADLMAVAMDNARERDAMRALASEQGAALRRVATLVAERVPAVTMFDSVAEEASRAFGADRVSIMRLGPRGTVTVAGSTDRVARESLEVVFELHQLPATADVVATGRTARIDDWSAIHGRVADDLTRDGVVSTVAAPIFVDGALWGVICTFGTEILPPDSEMRLTDFTHLVAGSITNLQAREAFRALADEQRALRRIATLVAQQTEPVAVFRAMAGELSRLMGCNDARLARYEDEHTVVSVDGTGALGDAMVAGTRFRIDDGDNIGVRILRTGQPARISRLPDGVTGSLGEFIRRYPIRDAMGAPIVVDGQLWGLIIMYWVGVEPPAEDVENRLAGFSDLLGLSIANADSRRKLISSRARVVRAGDETRQRIERNLHDGIQQRLVSLGLRLRTLGAHDAVPATVQADLGRITRDVEDVLEEIRVFSQGLHPVILARAGLAPSLRTLARRSQIPVELDVVSDRRFPAAIETAVYYLVSEALANAAKHSGASTVRVTVTAPSRTVHASVVDDGTGGAMVDAGAGTGLIGLVDRVEALGGRLILDSRPGVGTALRIEIPLDAEIQELGDVDIDADGTGAVV